MSRVKDFINWNEYENIVIFGCGEWGGLCLNILEKNNIKPVAFCDNDKNKQGTKFKDLTIYSLDEINQKFENLLIVVAVGDAGDIIIQLLNTKNDWVHLRNPDTETFVSSKIPKQSKHLLTSLETCESDILYSQGIELIITEKCSLKCRHCANLMQYYEKPINYSKEDMFLYLDKIDEIFDFVHDLKIIGGEPFMNKDIYDIIDYASSKESIICVSVYTNATIPINEEKLSKIDKNKLSFFATDYEKLSKNINQYVEIFDKYEIPYMYIEMDNWYDCSVINLVDRTICEFEEEYNRCIAKNHLGLIDGKIFLCPFSTHTYNLSAIPKEYVEYVDIINFDDINKIKQEMKEFIYNRKYAKACNYCLGRDTAKQGTLPPGLQTKDVLPYKKY